MKAKIISGLLVLLLGLPLMAAPPAVRPGAQQAAQTVDNGTYLDANQILIFITNHGNFGRDLAGVFGNDYGTYFPYTGNPGKISDGTLKDATPYYAGGLWIGAVDSATGDTLVTISEYSSEYVPGPMENGTFMADRSAFRVYKLYTDSLASNPNDDYLAWPTDQGAPTVYNAVLDEDVPEMWGDQMCWSVFNDADVDAHTNMQTDVMGLEVKFTAFSYVRTGSLGKMVFLKFQIYNKGDKVLNNCFMSLWSDPDLGTSTDDFVGVDTSLGLGYCYNSTAVDAKYNNVANPIPPAVGLDFFQGPLIYTGVESDTAHMWGDTLPGYVNMGIYSFNKYINGTDPDNYQETYWYMEGFDAKDNGAEVIDPISGLPTRYQVTGDPTTNPPTGWVDDTPGDRRMMQTTGPIDFRPGDSTEIVAALIVGQGSTYLKSITVLKSLDDYAQKGYDNGFKFPDPPVRPIVTVSRAHQEIVLSWTDTSEVNEGAYPFEGYTVWQGESESGPWTELKTYDKVNDRSGALIDTISDPYSGIPLPQALRSITNNGIRRTYEVTTDAIGGGKLRDLTEYYFKVTAFSFPEASGDTTYVDSLGEYVPTGDRLLESERVVAVRPVEYPAGVEPGAGLHSDLPLAHPTGSSGADVTVEVVDPLALTGHDYRIAFVDTPAVRIDTTYTKTETGWDSTFDTTNLAWHVIDVTTGDTVLPWRTNIRGNVAGFDQEYQVVDGMLIVVKDPLGGFSSFQCVANADGPIDPPEAAAAPWYNFPTPTGVDPDGYPTDGQQAGAGLWLIHTGDNGGSAGGGTRYSYEAFITRVMRAADDGGARFALMGVYDYEMRFTGTNETPGVGGGYGWDAFNTGEGYWVPFELWRTGIDTPDDPSDDVRLIPWILGDATGDGSGDNFEFDMSQYGSVADGSCHDGCEHSVSGGDNDPYTDWVYWRLPSNDVGDIAEVGDSAYLVFENAMETDPLNWAGDDLAIMDRIVLVNWNGGVEPPFNQDMPEEGTIFRILTPKPLTSADVYTFTAPAATTAGNEQALDAIKAVPNPFYMFGPYDPTPGNYQIYFHHLPEKCTITIYNLAGEFINRIDKDDPDSYAYWNLQTEKRLPVASGIYIYVVEAPGFGQKIGKLAVFYEAEVLDVY